ncbi:MAG: penicillin-binding protein 2 [Bacilli bacterium]|nr:penicillin-binding protein 2 [Bacilli bacterium]
MNKPKPLKIKKSQRKQNYKSFNRKKERNIASIIQKRYYVLIGIIILGMSILILDLCYIQIFKKEYYTKKVEELSTKIVEGSSVPRGRIYDRNHKLLVDNVPVKTIYYKKETGTTTKEEIELAYTLADILELNISSLKDSDLKDFWVKNNSEEANLKITEEEWKALEERKIDKDQIEELKMERITEEELNKYEERDKKAAYIYALMNKGYSYSEKVIKNKDVTDEEYAIIGENNLKGIGTKLDWERTYPYGNVFRTMLGTISTSESGIPYELKDDYLAKGYSLNDRVGTSYIEYQYEEYLKGVKNKYQVIGTEYKLIEEGTRGNDIVLTIDIELQQAIEKILEEEILKAKKEPNTSFYNRSFVVITDPNTGEVLAMAGKQIVEKNGEYVFYDYTPGVLTSPVVVGSVIKGASHIVGYNTGALKIGEVRQDDCIKIAATPLKCSWKPLGTLNDLTALKYSSNTYQFRTAIKVGGGIYSYDSPLSLNQEAFDIYRNTFAQFGLGVKTEIDMPLESLGYKGTSTQSGLLLDFAIGQYDTYTPIQLSQYISTIANGGSRLKPLLLKEVISPTNETIFQSEPVVLNTVDTKPEYLDRVKEGFKMVLEYGGTGSGSVDLKFKPAGKTGTSQSIIDTDGDGVGDTETITTTFAGYMPYDNPVMAMVVVSPDSFYQSTSSSYQYHVNYNISYEVSKKFFEIYQ